MKCKKHDVGMEVPPGGHFYCPECEAAEEDQPVCPECDEPTETHGIFNGDPVCSVCGELL